MGLKELYDEWKFRPILAGEKKTPREQASGEVAVNFMDETYQTQVKNRTPNDKTVTPSTEEDKTSGTFTDAAFKMYSTFLDKTKTRKYYNRDLATTHKYNGQGTDKERFTTSDAWKGSPGVLYSTNQ